MSFYKHTIVAIMCAFSGVNGRVFPLPITRTTIGWNIQFLGTSQNSQIQAPLGVQQQLSQRVQKRAYTSKATHQNGVFEMTGHHSDDEIVYFSIYRTPISIGNPPQNLTALVDTSWGPFFVPSANCTLDYYERQNCMDHSLYNSSRSSTYTADLTPVQLLYWGYSGVYTWGNISQDDLHIAGLHIKDQVFEEAIMWHPLWLTRDDYFDTALGLSLHQTFEPWSTFNASSPFQNMILQNLLDENVFALRLPRTDNETGELILGGSPELLRRSDMIEVPLNHSRSNVDLVWWDYFSSSGWQVSAQKVSMRNISTGGEEVTILTGEYTAIISSSYPYIALPDEAARAANHAIGLEELYDWVNCDTRADLPILTIALGPEGREVRLTPWDYLIQVFDDLFLELKCVSTFQSLGPKSDDGFVLLGAPFLSGGWSVWDADRESISFENWMI
ncbi:acid protease [Lentithecium fluviatile CBS 122367]|uniref:Acid protease n=1 Tax=Lentithecium fluviatile CBS 122367 TaxID=1168545 RepID=A0A6G1IQ40_9PLEO|nr:acid protease [Lentithecium fluviatile CBS 122367]